MSSENIEYLYGEMNKINQRRIKQVICHDLVKEFSTVSAWLKTSGTGVPKMHQKRVNEILQNWHTVNNRKLEKYL